MTRCYAPTSTTSRRTPSPRTTSPAAVTSSKAPTPLSSPPWSLPKAPLWPTSDPIVSKTGRTSSNSSRPTRSPTSSVSPRPSTTGLSSTTPTSPKRGATDLTLLTKDPIGAGIAALNTYDDANGTQEWSRGFNDLTAELAQAPRLDFTFDSATANSSTASAWASNSEAAFFGVWSSASSSSAQSQEFASSRVSSAGSFDHVTTFAVSPGKWFNSETLANAYAHSPSTSPPTPWNPNSTVNWDNTFGPNGNFERVCANLIVVSGMRITVTSQPTFSRADQDTIQSNSSAGMWPFYTRNDSANSHNEGTFDSSGRMTATISSVPAVPIVLACTVIPMKQYVGHQLKAFAATARR